MSKKTNNLLWWTMGAAALYAFTRSAANVGKLEDSYGLRPKTRVDQYWGEYVELINPRRYGVEAHNHNYYTDPNNAMQHFNLHSIEFGNWMNQEDRANFMYATLVTLRDIGKVINVPHHKLGMKGTLALSFGSRGQGGRAAAFYIPEPYHLINLTKPSGRGSFCHEFAHAVDFFTFGKANSAYVKDLRAQYKMALDLVLKNEDGSPSTYRLWLRRQGTYHNRMEEIWARICERYFHWQFKENGISNTWGVTVAGRDDLPSLELVKKAAPHIRKFFQGLNHL